MSDIRKRMAHVRATLKRPIAHPKAMRQRMEEQGLDTRFIEDFYKIAGFGPRPEYDSALE
jgi:hypothetical protein